MTKRGFSLCFIAMYKRKAMKGSSNTNQEEAFLVSDFDDYSISSLSGFFLVSNKKAYKTDIYIYKSVLYLDYIVGLQILH